MAEAGVSMGEADPRRGSQQAWVLGSYHHSNLLLGVARGDRVQRIAWLQGTPLLVIQRGYLLTHSAQLHDPFLGMKTYMSPVPLESEVTGTARRPVT